MSSLSITRIIILIVIIGTIIFSCTEAPYSPHNCDTIDSNPNIIRLSRVRAGWHQASKPAHISESVQNGKFLWHNTLYGIPAHEVYDHELPRGDNIITPFRLVHRPNSNGTSWSGIIKYIGLTDLKERLNLLEMRVRGDHGKLHIDLGKISEDLNNDGMMNAEQSNGDGSVTQEYDVGLDGLADEDEPGYDPMTNPDPNGDNWFFMGEGNCPVPENECAELVAKQSEALNGYFRYDSLYYNWLNGTEGNRDDITSVGRADSEQLIEGQFNTSNSYFSFSIDLAETLYEVPGSKNDFYWKTLRIPLTNAAVVDTAYSAGNAAPDWDQITHIRVWFEGDAGSGFDTLEIADWFFYLQPEDPYLIDTVSCQKGTWTVPSENRNTFIQLPCNYLSEGCITVYLNGVKLKLNIDYQLYLRFGKLRLFTDEARDPNALIQVEFGS